MKSIIFQLVVLIMALITYNGKAAANNINITKTETDCILLNAFETDNTEQELMAEKYMITFFNSVMNLSQNETDEDMNSILELKAEKLMFNYFTTTINKAKDEKNVVKDNNSTENENKLQKPDSTCGTYILNAKVNYSIPSTCVDNVKNDNESRSLQF